MEALYFTAAAVLLYLAADAAVRGIESRLGRALEYRSLIFFGILLVLAVGSFALIRQFAG